MSDIEHRIVAKNKIIETIDELIRSEASGFSQIMLIEQRNRIAKIFGHQQRGLLYYKSTEPGQ